MASTEATATQTADTNQLRVQSSDQYVTSATYPTVPRSIRASSNDKEENLK